MSTEPASPMPVGPAADPLLPWREPCATYVTHAIYARHGPALERFGEAGRKHCRLDVLRHLDYLGAAIEIGSAAPFVQYVLWLKEVLGGRGIPVAHIDFSLELMATFLGDKLAEPDLGMLLAVLKAARGSLAQSDTVAHYGLTRLPALTQTPAYQQALLQGQRNQALACAVQAMDGGATLAQVCVQMVQPAMYAIGSLWQQNRITVSQEHLASAISQNVLVGAYMRASFAPSTGQAAVFACVEGNHHGLGLRMLSDAFETQGWDAAYLGTDVPLQDLVRDIDTRRPQLLALSASLPQHLGMVRQTVEALRAELGTACPTIWVGGLATLSAESVWRYTRADGWSSDALHALEQL